LVRLTHKDTHLWEDYRENGDATPLILYYTKHAEKIAFKIHRNLPANIDIEDIKCSAMQGLWTAITRFDTSKNIPFHVYSRQIIKGQIIDHLRENDHESRALRKIQKTYDNVKNELVQELRREPTENELAEALDEDIDIVTENKSRIANSVKVHIYQKYGNDSDNSNYDLTNTLESKSRVYEPIDQIAVMENVISPWTKKEKLLFALIYIENLNLAKVSLILGISHPQICQMHYRIGTQLKKRIESSLKDA